MRLPRYASLPDLLVNFQSEHGADARITASVLLTYEFDPLLAHSLAHHGVLDGVGEDAAMFRWSGCFPGVLFYDPSRTQAGKPLPGNFEVRFWRRSGMRCHHPKAYAFLFSDGSAELILGSFNFTTAGLTTNREVLLRFHLCEKKRLHRPIFAEWRDLLVRHYLPRAPQSLQLKSYLNGLDRLLSRTASAEAGSQASDAVLHLIASGMDPSQTGFDALRRTAQEAGLSRVREVIAVSPFFDAGGARTFFSQLLEAFPELEAAHVFSDIPDDSWPAGAFPNAGRIDLRRYQISQTIEAAELGNLADRLGEDLDRKPAVLRRLHAKILILRDQSGAALLYAGSANFTAKAWLGGNVELGAVMKIPKWSWKNPADWVSGFFGLNSAGVRLVSAPMSTAGAAPLDPEDAEGLAFPTELESVELLCADEANLTRAGRFVFRAAPEVGHAPHLEGEFRWGDLELRLEWSSSDRAWFSQVIEGERLQAKLLAPRIIELRLNDASVRIPFNVSASLGAAAEIAFSTTPEASLGFLASLLNGVRQRRPIRAEACLSAGTENGTKIGSTETLSDTDREANACVRMQRWLRSLVELERALFDSEGRLRAAAGRADLPAYLDAASDLFSACDGSNPSDSIRAFFQTGELLLLAKRICAELCADETDAAQIWRPVIVRMNDRFNRSRKRLRAQGSDDVLPDLYASFVRKSIDAAE